MLLLQERRSNWKINDHNAAQRLLVKGRRLQNYKSAKAMAHQHGRIAQPRVGAHCHDLVREILGRVLLPAGTVTHPAQVESRDAIILRKKRRDEIPPMGMGETSVHE